MGIMKRSIKKATGYSKAKAKVKRGVGYTAARKAYKSCTSPAYYARKVSGVNTVRDAYYKHTTISAPAANRAARRSKATNPTQRTNTAAAIAAHPKAFALTCIAILALIIIL